jgi:putative ABC transport system permease protein
MIALILRLAWRETRAGFRSLIVLVVCVALGVTALVAVTGFAGNLDRALAREGKSLIGGDVELRSPRPLDTQTEAAIADLVARGATITRVRELAAMARHPERPSTLLVELKAVGEGYPLYGRFEARPARSVDELLADDGALADETALARLGVGIGDTVLVGDVTLVIRGVILNEPDRAGRIISLGPRLLVAAPTLDRAGLIQLGSRVNHRILLRLPDTLGATAVRGQLAAVIADPSIRVSAYDEGRPGWRRFYSQLTSYLGLVGMASLLVGGVGVAAAVRAFVARKRDTIAILKCLGATSRLLLAAYLVQAAGLGLIGSLAGAVLGVALAPLVGSLLSGLVPLALETRIDVWGLLRGVAIGTGLTMLIALWPLGEVRATSPSLLFRRDVEAGTRWTRRWLAALPLMAGACALVLWQAVSITVGAIFLGGVAAALLVLAFLARGVAWLGRRRPRFPSLAWRQGLANLARPGGHGVGVVVALGIGVMLLVTVGLLEASLGQQLDLERRREAPSFFFVDIQPEQRERFASIVREVSGVTPTITPVVRARLAALDGHAVTRALVEQRRARGDDGVGYFTRDYVLTAASALPVGNVVTAGQWWANGGTPAPQASVEEAAARHLGITVGSDIAFDVQGVRLAARVTSLRQVDWQSLTTNFFVILSPGTLDGAPTSYVATARVPPHAEGGVQDAVVRALPNVTAIPLRDVLERLGRVLDQMAVAVRAMALFAISAGLVVMAGALGASRYQRVSESVILRTLGATRSTVARVFAVEYACLGLAAGVGGSLLAAVLAWAVLRFVLDAPWVLAPLALALGLAVPTALALAVGSLATWRLLGEKPLPVLRRE